jgi:steroid 5-alpha reductase family enzyme
MILCHQKAIRANFYLRVYGDIQASELFWRSAFLVGLFLFALAANITYWWTIIGPVMITLLFTCISIPLIENHMLKRNPDYILQMKKISVFIPWRIKNDVAKQIYGWAESVR